MKITCHYSSSAGNLYQADDLLLEAGVPLRKARGALGYRLSSVSGCLVTHEHGDHARGAEAFMAAGVDIYCSEGTARKRGLKGHRLHIVEQGREFRVDRWRILPFYARHDSDDSLGFLAAKEDEKLLFVTDTQYVPFRFRGLTHIMLAVNFDADILRDRVLDKTLDISRATRTIQNHMNLQTAIQFFRANDMIRVQGIWLLHLSDENSDAERFRSVIERETGVPVVVASK